MYVLDGEIQQFRHQDEDAVEFGFGRKLDGFAGQYGCQKAVRVLFQFDFHDKVDGGHFHEGEHVVLAQLFFEDCSFLLKGVKLGLNVFDISLAKFCLDVG
jgi:hypothetical protein